MQTSREKSVTLHGCVALLKTVFFVMRNDKNSKSAAVSPALRITHIHDGNNMIRRTAKNKRAHILLLKREHDWQVKCKLSGAGGVRKPLNSLRCDG